MHRLVEVGSSSLADDVGEAVSQMGVLEPPQVHANIRLLVMLRSRGRRLNRATATSIVDNGSVRRKC